MSQNKPLLRVDHVSVSFGEQRVVHDVTFEIRPEEVLAIIGPNGSGKSVLLKTLVGLLRPSAGTIEWAPNIRIGYIPQRFQVDRYLPMTVKEFLSLKPNPEYSVPEVLSLINLGGTWAKKNIAHLSGGELQKMLLAWALIDKPHILLFDEPTENVDIVSQESIYHLLHELQDKMGIAMIIISHDLHVVYAHANHVLCLNEKQICYGEPQKELTKDRLAELYGDHAFFHHHHTESV